VSGALGAVPRMELQTETAANNFPRLPIRGREAVFLWIGKWSGVAEFQAFLEQWQSKAVGGIRRLSP
jgi:hypothetical protein